MTHSSFAECLGCMTLLVTSAGCLTAKTLEWKKDEVVLLGTSDSKGQPDHVFFRVKNLEGVSNELFAVSIPIDWSQRPRHETPEGVLELNELLDESCGSFRESGSWVTEAAVSLDAKEVRRRPPGWPPYHHYEEGDERYGVEVHRAEGRKFSVTVYGEVVDEERWVRLVSIPIGIGTQSSARKPIAIAALPFAVAVDVVTLPFAWVLVMLQGGRG